MDIEVSKVIDKIKQIRNTKSISYLELEKLTGISHSFLYYIEAKKKIPSLTTLNKIAKGLKVRMKDFFE